ncbi:hypothetical protein MA3A0930S_4153 [Mycobacteroides abscessus 3A-0930-S]|nr:hypothetical protein MA4S0726RB_3293 [Mycobacteroides abscessus 4S-0726-RB]EIV23411.1 hypothetical protein MA3A0122R_4307 [Mycobacteroides abscessus 3A-0122-R]EIV45361.1 hypothetical protein MA3A0930S_4153 [Mycobacteroides abscessus 3A-0930-S]EIV59939.1 hypothetical protein MA4S0116S_2839 [Mycobacteroides abscessus 4S-0116-S]EUA76070.1 hypothetical protein I541_3656 [Mycobacteroides abscessus]EUA80169.1 hypothetical protein I544_1464 [Mycobacteroides abscessus subsp. bolletii 103]
MAFHHRDQDTLCGHPAAVLPDITGPRRLRYLTRNMEMTAIIRAIGELAREWSGT